MRELGGNRVIEDSDVQESMQCTDILHDKRLSWTAKGILIFVRLVEGSISMTTPLVLRYVRQYSKESTEELLPHLQPIEELWVSNEFRSSIPTMPFMAFSVQKESFRYDILEKTDITWAAKAILLYIEFHFIEMTKKDLVSVSTDTSKSITAYANELVEQGYISKKSLQQAFRETVQQVFDRKPFTDWVVYLNMDKELKKYRGKKQELFYEASYRTAWYNGGECEQFSILLKDKEYIPLVIRIYPDGSYETQTDTIPFQVKINPEKKEIRIDALCDLRYEGREVWMHGFDSQYEVAVAL